MANARHVACCIAGGGPAGLMLGFLLARAGVGVVVIEKHADFLRDFRGDTIHPSTLEIMSELGLYDDVLRLPHEKLGRIAAQFGTGRLEVDFSRLPTRAKFIAMMPQWDFLSFLARQGERYEGFDLRMCTEATDLLVEGDRVVGIRVSAPEGRGEIRADLVVAADGRHSALQGCSGLARIDLGAPMDVLWFRLQREAGDPVLSGGRFEAGRIFVMINRGSYWQCAFVIPKGANEAVRARGLDAFRDAVAERAGVARERLAAISSFDEVKLLTVAVDRLERWWRPGLLCIGDAAHAMSPVGGVGVNLAIQDAVAAANILARPLREGSATDDHLAAVERRRAWPTRMTQRIQIALQNRLIGPALAAGRPLTVPLPIRLMQRYPWLQRIPARLVGIGVRPEHVETDEITG
jgi:2-polyprenyl-6-methoxyphenol hydroxylase-like FAD-dependent oxidoreductase